MDGAPVDDLQQADPLADGTATWTVDSETTSIMVVWFVPFTFCFMQVVKMFWRLLAEIQAGTIAGLPLPAPELAGGRWRSPEPPWSGSGSSSSTTPSWSW